MGDDIFKGSNHQGINLKNIQTAQYQKTTQSKNWVEDLNVSPKKTLRWWKTMWKDAQYHYYRSANQNYNEVSSHTGQNAHYQKNLQTINAGMHAKSLQSCLTLCDPVDCSPPSSSVHGILRARVLEWVAISKCWRGCGEKGIPLHCWWECKLVLPLWWRVWKLLKKMRMELPYDPAIPLLGFNLDKIIIQDIGNPYFQGRMWKVEIVSFWKMASIINILPNDSLVLSLCLHHTGAYPLSLHNLSSFLRISSFTSLPLRNWRLPWWLSGKESPANAGDQGSIPGSGIFLWRRKWQATCSSILAWEIPWTEELDRV